MQRCTVLQHKPIEITFNDKNTESKYLALEEIRINKIVSISIKIETWNEKLNLLHSFRCLEETDVKNMLLFFSLVYCLCKAALLNISIRFSVQCAVAFVCLSIVTCWVARISKCKTDYLQHAKRFIRLNYTLECDHFTQISVDLYCLFGLMF